MQFISIPRIVSVALSAAILIVFACHTLGAEDTQNPEATTGVSSVLKIKDSSAVSNAKEKEKAESGTPIQSSAGISTNAKRKSDLKDTKSKTVKSAETPSGNIVNKDNSLKQPIAIGEEEASLATPKNQESAHNASLLDKSSSIKQPQKTLNPPTLEAIPNEKNTGVGEASVSDGDALANDQAPNPDDTAILKPIPNPDEVGPVALEAASFNGVTPGITTMKEVEKLWGAPKEIIKQNDLMTQLFSVKPFERVEISYRKDTVASVVIRFDRPFPADKIALQLDMATVKPVLVSNELGEILGQVYPERGVLFAFESSEDKTKPSMKVTHLILEPLNADPFILRAETELDNHSDSSIRDLELALSFQPDNARVHWLLSRVLSATDQLEKAEEASTEAVRLEPGNPRYRVTKAQILGQMGNLPEAIREAEKAVNTSDDYPHIQARALSMLGDLTASGPKPDYRKAIKYHTQAVQVADSVANDTHPAIRIAAKEVLVDAHLGAVHDIAWGDWKEKDVAVNKWLDRAAAFAEDLVKNEGCSEEHQFRVCTRALAAYVGIRGKIDPESRITETISRGREMIDSASDPARKAQYQWDLGMALYDAVQIYQMRSDNERAMKYATASVEYLEQGRERKQTLTVDYTLGRLYFRLGAMHAIRDQNHKQAVVWFEKAIPLLLKPLPLEAEADLGREGETFVSMGVSYWEIKQHEKAVKLTQHGIEQMEEAIGKGMLDRSALVTPYNNLAAMHRQLGSSEEAVRYQKMAAKINANTVK